MLIFIAILMMIGAGGLLIYNNNEDARVVEGNQKAIEEIENAIKKNNIDKSEELTDNDISEITTNIGNNTKIEVQGNNYIGILYIPSLNNLTIPIISEWSYPNLKISACRYSGNLENNNLVIAGHNYKSTFAKLFDLQEGSIAYFKSTNGLVYKYKLNKIEILQPTDVGKMKRSDYDLTVFTCTYGGENRYTLRFLREI